MKDTLNFTGKVWLNEVCTRGYEDELIQEKYEEFYDTDRSLDDIQYAINYGENEFSLLSDYFKDCLKDELLNGDHTCSIEEGVARYSIPIDNRVWVEVLIDVDPDLSINILDSNDEVELGDVERFIDELVRYGEADMDLDIEISRLIEEPVVEDVQRDTTDNKYLTGVIYVNRDAVCFDYNTETDEIEFHKYTEPGWITGSSYETYLPAEFSDEFSYNEIIYACDNAINDFLENEKSAPSHDDEER